jgi:hypothetical protein
MKSYEELLKKRNDLIEKEYTNSLEKVKAIWEELKEDSGAVASYLFAIADKILYFSELEKEADDLYKNSTLAELEKINLEIYNEILPGSYNSSYANPDHCVNLFGTELGAAYASFYTNFRNFVTYSFQHMRFEMLLRIKPFIELYNAIKMNELNKGILLNIMTSRERESTTDDEIIRFTRNYSTATRMYKRIVLDADLNDIRYLYGYGRYVSINEIETAKFLAKLPQTEIDILAKAITKAFIRGYELAKKDLSSRPNIGVYYHLGQERIAKAVVNELEKNNLQGILSSIFTTQPNKQYSYDHRFDNALFLDEKYVENNTKHLQEAAEACKKMLQKFAGPIYFDTFGEAPFSPQNKESCLKLSPEQQKLQQQARLNYSKIIQEYMSRSQTSFCIVGFPLPEIGDQFTEIFAETMAINMMDTEHHEQIQQFIVDALDKAEYVHVKGKNGNLTDIKVKMWQLKDPAKHTNFVNCGADVNVPVGEVFTSPQLTGTNGLLHVKESFLKGLKFTDLKLHFKDGYVEDYSCKNFPKEAENKKYIEENLLFPHKTLPLGEFAIGTNTRAYVMAGKFNILNVLPVLIVEKMGPHFAIGDTCFSWEEDFAVFNPIDGKEITARDNEKSILRKEDVAKAYTNCHTDITLPYENLDYISGITSEGEKIDIIRNGKFVVPGTEELNKYFD